MNTGWVCKDARLYIDGKYLGEVIGMEIKHGDTKQTWETGAQRDTQEGKGRFDLIEPSFLFKVAGVNEGGAKHYGDRNYRKGIPLNRYIDSAFRHLLKWLRGDRDEPHLAQAAWNIEKLDWTADQILAGKLPRSLDPHGYLDGDFNKLTAEEDESVDCGETLEDDSHDERLAADMDDNRPIYPPREPDESKCPCGCGMPRGFVTGLFNFAKDYVTDVTVDSDAGTIKTVTVTKPPYFQSVEELAESFREKRDEAGREKDADTKARELLDRGPMFLTDYYREMLADGFTGVPAYQARRRLDTVTWNDPRPWVTKCWVGYKQDVPNGVKEVR